jgi:hypothetical protein
VKADLLGPALTVLEEHGTPAALTGGMALAVYGVVRATFDFDLLCLDPRLLQPTWWTRLAKEGVTIEICRGDHHDPFVGLVRLAADDQADIDLLVGQRRWLEGVLARRQAVAVAGRNLPVVDPADLILLKLDARGPQDLFDIQLLLRSPDGEEWARDVTDRLPEVPPAIERTWNEILSAAG